LSASNLGDVNWNHSKKVSPVKDQGQCGSCWAFSATGAIESALLIKNITANLAEQQLVDCSGAYGNYGCNGGWMDSAFQYIIDHNITETSKYPYVARDQACKLNTGTWSLSGFVDTPGCTNLLNALHIQPISVAVDASNWSSYKSGVFSSCGTNVNHGVLLVGTVNPTHDANGTQVTNGTWIIKNSWSSGWGDAGFIRLLRVGNITASNTCAICSYPSYPTLPK